MKGFWGSKVSAAMPADKRNALFGELITAAVSGGITLPVAGVYVLDDIHDAVHASDRQGRVGKVLLKP